MIDEKDTSSATWKFQFENTVNADPMAKGGCLKVVRVLLDFASKSDPRAFCSLSNLMLATSLTRPTVKKALQILIRLKYLEPLFVTEEGAMMYRLVNARKELIDDHLRIAKQKLASDRADRKRRERIKRGVKETCPPQEPQDERNFPPKVKETFPNTVELSRRDSCSEGREGLIGAYPPSNDNPYSMVDDDLTVPFDVPNSDEEAEQVFAEILTHVGSVNPAIQRALRSMFMAGELSPALLTANLGDGHG